MLSINVLVSFPAKKTGIPRQNEELLRRMIKSSEIDHVDLLCPRSAGHVSQEILSNTKVSLFFHTPFQTLKVFRIIVRNKFMLSMDIGGKTYLLTYFLVLLMRPWIKVRIIQFVADFVVYRYPNTLPRRTRVSYQLFKILFSKIPDRFIVISQSTKRDMITFWGIPAEKIDILPLGSFTTSGVPRVNFGSKRILYIGTLEPRKNLDRLLDAFFIVQKDIRDAKFLIVGKIGWKVEGLVRRINALVKENPNIQYLGYVSDEAIKKLYQSADVFVYPSLYEGFGLPPLEAMSCGCPVITSNISSLPEVVGDAAILVDPYNTREITDAILKVLRNDNLKREMSKKGIEQAKKFNWDTSAEKLMRIIKATLVAHPYNENSPGY